MQMKLALLVVPFIFAQAFAVEHCYSEVVGACSPVGEYKSLIIHVPSSIGLT